MRHGRKVIWFAVRFICFGLLLGLAACSADPAPTTRRDAGSVAEDAGRPERDSGAEEDAGGEEDAGPPPVDAGPECPVVGTCDIFDRDTCHHTESCRPTPEGSVACRPLEDNPFGLDEACTTAASCEPGLLCLDFGSGNRCVALCPEDSVGMCPDGWQCSGGSTTDCLATCRRAPERCDIYANDCSNGTDLCRPSFDAEREEPVTICSAAGPRALGESCGSGMGNCQRGLLCVRAGEGTACREVCQENSDCGAGTTCNGMISTWDITYCVPE